MRRINTDILLPGDIVLTTEEAWVSRAVRWGTFSDISHAMICVSRSSVMDSTAEGVHARNPQKMFYPDGCAIHVLRLHEATEPSVIVAAINYVRGTTGSFYDIKSAVRAAAFPRKKVGNARQFCSRLVAQAYAFAGVKLVTNPDFCTPEDLKTSRLLSPVSGCSVNASEDDVAAAEGDMTKDMRAVTNAFIHGVADLGHEVESFRDVITLAAAKPELDEAIAEKLVESKYLDLWKEDAKKFWWRYDIAEMVQFQNAVKAAEPDITTELRAYCESTLADDAQGAFLHWQDSLEAVNSLNKDFPRRTFALLQDLHFNLVLQHSKRASAARTWLQWQDAAARKS